MADRDMNYDEASDHQQPSSWSLVNNPRSSDFFAGGENIDITELVRTVPLSPEEVRILREVDGVELTEEQIQNLEGDELVTLRAQVVIAGTYELLAEKEGIPRLEDHLGITSRYRNLRTRVLEIASTHDLRGIEADLSVMPEARGDFMGQSLFIIETAIHAMGIREVDKAAILEMQTISGKLTGLKEHLESRVDLIRRWESYSKKREQPGRWFSFTQAVRYETYRLIQQMRDDFPKLDRISIQRIAEAGIISADTPILTATGTFAHQFEEAQYSRIPYLLGIASRINSELDITVLRDKEGIPVEFTGELESFMQRLFNYNQQWFLGAMPEGLNPEETQSVRAARLRDKREYEEGMVDRLRAIAGGNEELMARYLVRIVNYAAATASIGSIGALPTHDLASSSIEAVLTGVIREERIFSDIMAAGLSLTTAISDPGETIFTREDYSDLTDAKEG